MMADNARTDIRYVEMHGERVAYRDTGGNGEVVLLLHGMAGSSDTWRAIMPSLAERHRVIAPDLLGHGRSDKPRTDYSLGAFAAGLRDLLDELGVERGTIVGQSLGGGVAMQFVYQHPEYCERLVLISSGGLGPDVGWILRLLSAPGAEFVLPFIAPKVVLAVGDQVRPWLSRTRWGSPEADQTWLAYSSLSDPPTRSAFLRTLRSVVDYRGQSVSALSRLRLRSELPTLVIWGEKDPIIPVEHGYQVHAARPNSTLIVLPGLGHFPHVESPAEVAALIDDFIATRHTEQGLAAMLTAHQQVEIAVGLLMGLRGCSHTEADNDFRAAVDETDVAAEELARALVTAADTDTPSEVGVPLDHRQRVRQRWGALLAGRGLDGGDDTATIPEHMRVRYGPGNESTMC